MADEGYVPYQTYCPIDCSVEHRRKHHVGDIFENKVKCLKCGDIILSKHRHDMTWCSCGSIAVDGGSWYIRRVGDIGNCEDMTRWYEHIQQVQHATHAEPS